MVSGISPITAIGNPNWWERDSVLYLKLQTDTLDRSPYVHQTSAVNIGFSVVGGIACASFNGVDSYVRIPTNSIFDPLADAFTVDWWEYRNEITNGQVAIGFRAEYPTPFAWGFSPQDDSNVRYYASTTGATSFDLLNASYGGTAVSDWTHRSIGRDSAKTFYIFENGIKQNEISGRTSAIESILSIQYLYIGSYGDFWFDGYFRNIRFSNFNRWSANYTPPELN